MTFRALLLVFFAAFAAGNAAAVTLYLTETDSDGIVYIIDTDAGTFVTRDVSPQENPGAIAIYTNRIVMANYPDTGSWEYDFDLNPTGNSWPGADTWSQMLDGTTDGNAAYAVSWSSNGVIECDANFTNCSVLFNPGFSVIGVTYDPTNDSFWVVNSDSNTVHNFDRGGNELSNFVADLEDRNCCLAYDQGTDTLWMSTNASPTMVNVAKDGTIIEQVTIAGLTPDNTWGAEIIGGAASPPPGPARSIPALGTLGLLALTLLLMLGALLAIRYSH